MYIKNRISEVLIVIFPVLIGTWDPVNVLFCCSAYVVIIGFLPTLDRKEDREYR